MSNYRSILAWIVILASVAYHVSQWADVTEDIQDSPQRIFSVEERMFLFQSKVILGSKDAFQELVSSSSPVMAQSAWQSYNQGVNQVVTQIFNDAPQDLESFNKRILLREKIILALRLGKFQQVDELSKALTSSKRNEYEESVDAVFLSVVDRQKSKVDPTLSDDERRMLNEELLEFTQFLEVKLEEGTLVLAPEVKTEVKQRASNFFLGAVIFIGLIGLAALFFLFYTWLFLTGRTKFQFKKSGMPKYLSVETFALYMATMFIAPRILRFLILEGYITELLIGNVIVISATIVVLAWPVICGQPIYSVRHAYGVYIGSFKGLVKNILIAPTFYLAGWIIFIAALIGYGLLLEKLHVQVERGAHPIVPLLLESKDGNTPFLILLLATVVAPVIEEIMFRGALYSGLRSYVKAPFAILASALIFASVHPQGAIGMLPLTFIGIFLAFLREWRGSLVSPILAHACVNGGTLILVTLLMK